MALIILFVAGIIIANFLEWAIHKYILHELGKKKKSIFSFHWGVHHRKARKNRFYDDSTSTREIIGIALLCLLFSPVYVLSPIVYAGMLSYVLTYYALHSYAHKNPVFAYTYMRWHWDHHMGKDQNTNWCVVIPLADYVLGTRKKYM